MPSWRTIASVVVAVLAVSVLVQVASGRAGWAAADGVLLGAWVAVLVHEWSKAT